MLKTDELRDLYRIAYHCRIALAARIVLKYADPLVNQTLNGIPSV
jgi:hypothetical protein